MGRKSAQKVPAFVDCLVAIGTIHLLKPCRLTEGQAQTVLHKIAESVCHHFAKVVMYICACDAQRGGDRPWRTSSGNPLVHELFDFMVATGVEQLRAASTASAEQLQRAMLEVAGLTFWSFGGSVLYVPAYVEPFLQLRDQAILLEYATDGPDGARKFTSKRLLQIARNNDLTIGHAYGILSRQRQLARQGQARPGQLDDAQSTGHGGKAGGAPPEVEASAVCA